MRFSIITVCRNSEALLPRAMESLAAQTCADYEWLVIDGASTDKTVAVAKGFAAAPSTCISEPDAGIYDAMNKAVALAKGDYLYFLNSDDRLAHPQVLAQVSNAIHADYEPDLVIGRIWFESQGGAQKKLRDYSHLNARNIVFDSLCHQAVFARRSLFARFGHFDTGYRLAADFDWLCRAVRSGARTKFCSFDVAVFSDGGAHARASQQTHTEVLQIRQRHLRPLERAWAHGTAWLQHKGRRLLGLPAQGRAAPGETDAQS
jgi:glycosyltransferase involved in cell wall biosynthesis